jgi:hypothetical protein
MSATNRDGSVSAKLCRCPGQVEKPGEWGTHVTKEIIIVQVWEFVLSSAVVGNDSFENTRYSIKFFIIYMPSKQLSVQLHTQHSVDTRY